MNDAQCPGAKWCSSTGTCMYTTCTSSSSCPTGQICTGNVCDFPECTTDSQCSSTQQCTNNQCVAKPTTKDYSWKLEDGTCREGVVTTGCNAPKFQTQTWKCVNQSGNEVSEYNCTSQGDAKPSAPSPIECNEKVGGCASNEYCWTGYTDYKTSNGVVIVDVRGKCEVSSSGNESNAAFNTHHNTLALFVTLMLALVACVFTA